MHVLRRALTCVAVGGLLVAAIPTMSPTAGRPSPITVAELTIC